MCAVASLHTRALRHLCCLLATWTLLTWTGLAEAGRCPVLWSNANVDWREISGKFWFEIATHPPIQSCVVRTYYPERGVMMWYDLERYGGRTKKVKEYKFFVDSSVQFLQRDGRFFQQILDTDNRSWALVYVCSQNDGKPKILFTTLEPWDAIPVEIQQRITMALQKAGMPIVPLMRSTCQSPWR
ncbi:uncharacterized protein LOC144146241 [Haemaphysalis longicornis]